MPKIKSFMATVTYCLPLLEQSLPKSQYLARVRRALLSLAKQSVPYWRCHLVVRADLAAEVSALIESITTDYPHESSAFAVHSTVNNTIVNAVQVAASQVTGAAVDDPLAAWMVVLRDDTQLASHATYSYLSMTLQQPEAILVYGDHDQIDVLGRRQNPFFKPEFSLDLLYSQNYIGPIFAIQTQYLLSQHHKNIESNQSFALAAILAAVRKVASVHVDKAVPIDYRKHLLHVPSVLHHHEVDFVNQAQEAFDEAESARLVSERSQGNLKLLNDHFDSLKHNAGSPSKLEGSKLASSTDTYRDLTQAVASVSEVKPFVYRSTWPIPNDCPLVSLIIPTRDGYEILKACLDSILAKTTYKHYEILIVNNQSSDPKTLELLSAMATVYENIRVIDYDAEFNYSAINNYAVGFASGSIVGFVNNDIEVISPDWLTEMVSHSLRDDIGCVGAMHFYPDDSIQHAGVIVGLDGVAGHAFRFENKSSNEDYFNYLSSIRNPDAVTAATLLIRKELFQRVGGFDAKHLAVAFNDVDLCLKVNALGYRCVWTPYAELYHHESKTRKLTSSLEATKREMYEHAVMKQRWGTDTYQSRELLQYKKVVA